MDTDALCAVILVKGERKNQACNRKSIVVNSDGTRLCRLHHNMELKRPHNPYVDNEYPLRLENGAVECEQGSVQMSLLHPSLAEELRAYIMEGSVPSDG